MLTPPSTGIDNTSSYAGSSGGASFSSFAESAASTEGLELDFTSRGVDLSGFPLPTQADLTANPDAFVDWVNAIRVAMVEQGGVPIDPGDRGLLLMPMSAYPYAPLGIVQQNFDVGLLTAYSNEVRASLGALVTANRWRAPLRLREFIEGLDGGNGAPLLDEVDLARIALLQKLDTLATTAKTYAKDYAADPLNTSSDPLLMAASEAQEAREALEGLLNLVIDRIAQLNSSIAYDTSDPGQGWFDIGNIGGTSRNRYRGDFWLRDIAVFPSSPDLSSYTEATQPLIRFGEINTPGCGGTTQFSQVVADDRLTSFEVVDYVVDQVSGLTDVRILFEFDAPYDDVNVCEGQVIIQDELFRVLFEGAIQVN